MQNLVGVVELYFDFVLLNEEYRQSNDLANCLADSVVNYWRMLLFVVEEDLDDAAKAEESLIYSITTMFTEAEKMALQKAARKQLQERFSEQQDIDPEDESQNREQRFLTFIATGRFNDMDLL